MKYKLIKFVLPIASIGIVGASVVIATSCSESGLSEKKISEILQVYKDEASAPINDGQNIANVGKIGDFPSYTPNDTDVNHWNDANKDAVADATSWSDQIVAPLKTYIANNIKDGNSLYGTSDDSRITQIEGYKSFIEGYFSVHLANIYAEKIVGKTNGWVFNDSNAYKPFECLQNQDDNAKFDKDSSYAGSKYKDENQIPQYMEDKTDLKGFYQELNLPYLWSPELFDKDNKKPLYRPYFDEGDYYAKLMVSYLVTFSPKPWTNEAPPIAFYVYAELSCAGIS